MFVCFSVLWLMFSMLMVDSGLVGSLLNRCFVLLCVVIMFLVIWLCSVVVMVVCVLFDSVFLLLSRFDFSVIVNLMLCLMWCICVRL